MRLTIVKTALLLCFVFLNPGCKKSLIVHDSQVILFQYDYVNYAWGYNHHGFFIDSEGNILAYDNPEDWNFPGQNYVISQSQLDENLSKCSNVARKVTAEEIEKYSKYIHNIASSKVTALKNASADAGKAEYLCYQFSEFYGSYKGTLIKMEGDNTCENLNFHSKRVAMWIKEIGESLALK